MTVLHLTGPVLVDEETTLGQCWVVDGRVTFASPLSRRSPDAVTIEGVVLPGLVDVHCHVGLGPDGAVSAQEAEAQARADRDAGTLLIRDAGSPADTRWIDDRPDLPRLIRAGHHLARPRRYLRHYGRELTVPELLPGAVTEELARGDGWIKLVADWIDRDLGPEADLTPLWPDELLARAVGIAHAAGARVTAHTFSTEAVPGLLAAGIDCLEHGTGLTDDQITEVARRAVPVVPTLLQVAQFERIAEQGARFERFAARMRAMHERRYRHVAHLHEAGVPLLVGTDAGGTIGHGRLPEEAAEMVRAGVPAPGVVAAASYAARRYLGVPGIAEGAPADLVVYPADPRTDIALLAHPRAVVLGGRVVRG